MSLWLSVVVKEGGHVLNEFIGSVIDGLASEFSGRTVNRLIISTSENFSSCHEVSLNTPLLALQEFGCKYVCCFMERPDSSANVPGRPAVRDAFSVLIAVASVYIVFEFIIRK